MARYWSVQEKHFFHDCNCQWFKHGWSVIQIIAKRLNHFKMARFNPIGIRLIFSKSKWRIRLETAALEHFVSIVSSQVSAIRKKMPPGFESSSHYEKWKENGKRPWWKRKKRKSPENKWIENKTKPNKNTFHISRHRQSWLVDRTGHAELKKKIALSSTN